MQPNLIFLFNTVRTKNKYVGVLKFVKYFSKLYKRFEDTQYISLYNSRFKDTRYKVKFILEQTIEIKRGSRCMVVFFL